LFRHIARRETGVLQRPLRKCDRRPGRASARFTPTSFAPIISPVSAALRDKARDPFSGSPSSQHEAGDAAGEIERSLEMSPSALQARSGGADDPSRGLSMRQPTRSLAKDSKNDGFRPRLGTPSLFRRFLLATLDETSRCWIFYSIIAPRSSVANFYSLYPSGCSALR
jgi:hypothetical protein